MGLIEPVFESPCGGETPAVLWSKGVTRTHGDGLLLCGTFKNTTSSFSLLSALIFCFFLAAKGLIFSAMPDLITVSEFVAETNEDYKSPTASNFTTRMSHCRNTVAALEEVSDPAGDFIELQTSIYHQSYFKSSFVQFATNPLMLH